MHWFVSIHRYGIIVMKVYTINKQMHALASNVLTWIMVRFLVSCPLKARDYSLLNVYMEMDDIINFML